MKKLLAVICAVFLGAASLSSETMPYIKNGDYTYYLDNRGTMNYARGYLARHLPNGAVLFNMNVINLNDGKKYRINAVGKDDLSGQFEFTLVTGLEDVPEEYRNEAAQTLVDILNYDAMYLCHENEIGYDTTLEDPWDDYIQYYHYNKILPLFKFSEITNSLYKGKVSARIIGRLPDMEQESIEKFYQIEASDFNASHGDAPVEIPSAEKMKVKLSGFEVSLDKNWELNSFEGNDSWWLKVQTIRDAQLMVESFPENIPLKTKEQRFEIAQLLITQLQNILPGTISVQEDKNSLTVQYESYDENNLVSVTKMKLMPGKCVNFSAFKDIYCANEEYFNKILKSVKKSK